LKFFQITIQDLVPMTQKTVYYNS